MLRCARVSLENSREFQTRRGRWEGKRSPRSQIKLLSRCRASDNSLGENALLELCMSSITILERQYLAEYFTK